MADFGMEVEAMNFTFSPLLGWYVGGIIAALMLVLILVEIAHFIKSNNDETVLTCIRRVLICGAVALLALTPSVKSNVTTRAINATNIIIAVDTTGSMGVRDAQYGSDTTITRIQAAKAAVNDITKSYSNASFAAIHFAQSASVDVPLTPDASAITQWNNSLRLEQTSTSAGSSLDMPLNRLILTFNEIKQQHPNDTNILYLITDGEQTSTSARKSFSALRNYVTTGFILGVGSTQGGNIPTVDDRNISSGNQTSDNWIIDPDTNQPAISKMDPTTLGNMADEIGGTFIALNNKNTVANSAVASSSQEWRIRNEVKTRERYTPIIWPLYYVLFALVLWELLVWLKVSRNLI
ncbi:MAG: vWA domain-containing protein [Bifidobacteriaceae bacterium]|nr:vWA domain-containing protein [Bifidobacteriaceae bacterium]